MILIIKHVLIESPGLITEYFKNKKIKIIELENNEKIPKSLKGIEAVISLGGPMNVYEEEKYPFLKDEDVFLKKVIKNEIPFLGICLGGQLLAKSANAKVTKAKQKEIGWFTVDLTYEGIKDSLFKGLPKSFTVFQWHGDQFEVPSDGILLSKSEVCNQAFKLGRCAYAIQFHFEVTSHIIETWIKNFIDECDVTNGISVDEIIQNTFKHFDNYEIQANLILSNFNKIIQKNNKQKIK